MKSIIASKSRSTSRDKSYITSVDDNQREEEISALKNESAVINYMTSNLTGLEKEILTGVNNWGKLQTGQRYIISLKETAAKFRKLSMLCFASTEITNKVKLTPVEVEKYNALLGLGFFDPMDVKQKNILKQPTTFTLSESAFKKYETIIFNKLYKLNDNGYVEHIEHKFDVNGVSTSLTEDEIDKFTYLITAKQLNTAAILQNKYQVEQEFILISSIEQGRYTAVLESGMVKDNVISSDEIPLESKIFLSDEYYKITSNLTILIAADIIRQNSSDSLVQLHAERWIYLAKLAYEGGDFFMAMVIRDALDMAMSKNSNAESNKLGFCLSELSDNALAIYNYLSIYSNPVDTNEIQVLKYQSTDKSGATIIPFLAALTSKIENINGHIHEKTGTNKNKTSKLIEIYLQMQNATHYAGENIPNVMAVIRRDLLSKDLPALQKMKDFYARNAQKNIVRPKSIDCKSLINQMQIYSDADKFYNNSFKLREIIKKLEVMEGKNEGKQFNDENRIILGNILNVLKKKEFDEDAKLGKLTAIETHERNIHYVLLSEITAAKKELVELASCKYHRLEIMGSPELADNNLVMELFAKSRKNLDKTSTTKFDSIRIKKSGFERSANRSSGSFNEPWEGSSKHSHRRSKEIKSGLQNSITDIKLDSGKDSKRHSMKVTKQDTPRKSSRHSRKLDKSPDEILIADSQKEDLNILDQSALGLPAQTTTSESTTMMMTCLMSPVLDTTNTVITNESLETELSTPIFPVKPVENKVTRQMSIQNFNLLNPVLDRNIDAIVTDRKNRVAFIENNRKKEEGSPNSPRLQNFFTPTNNEKVVDNEPQLRRASTYAGGEKRERTGVQELIIRFESHQGVLTKK